MRVFVAAELPLAVKREIAETQKGFQELGVEARWVDPDIAHLTLAFLGSITPEKAGIAGNILEEVWGQVKPLDLRIGQLGCFPKPSLAKIIFFSLGGETGKLTSRVKETRKRLKAAEIYFDETPFLPHLTLGRIRDRQNLNEVFKKIRILPINFSLNHISLVKSTLARSGPIYQNLKTVVLK